MIGRFIAGKLPMTIYGPKGNNGTQAHEIKPNVETPSRNCSENQI